MQIFCSSRRAGKIQRQGGADRSLLVPSPCAASRLYLSCIRRSGPAMSPQQTSETKLNVQMPDITLLMNITPVVHTHIDGSRSIRGTPQLAQAC